MDTKKTDKRKPKIENARGLVWEHPKSGGLIARWKARTDIRERGFEPETARIWSGEWPTPTECLYIASQCERLQTEMLVWARGGMPPPRADHFETLADLIAQYKTDPDSGYRKLRYRSQQNYDSRLRRIERDYGGELVANIKGRQFLRWHEAWIGEKNQIPMAHELMTTLRLLFSFGGATLEDERCKRLSVILSTFRFQKGKPRTERMTAEQATAIRAMAHRMGRPSIALAQAFQFELALRQRDVIGEWVPASEKTEPTDVVDGLWKWARGIRWTEISEGLILRHTTSKRGKEVEFDLRSAGMVMDELKHLEKIPASGPVIVNETTGRPWSAERFRYNWRQIATACGVPKTVRNMDSRAGAISEASDAGVPLDHARAMATHSDQAQTIKYTRQDTEKVNNVLQMRAEHRAKKPKE